MSSHDTLVRCIRQAEILTKNCTNENILRLVSHMKEELKEYDFWYEKLENGTETQKMVANYWLNQGQGKDIEIAYHNYVQSIWHGLTEI